MEIKNLIMRKDFEPKFSITKHTFEKKFTPMCSCTTWECVIQKKLSNFVF